MNNFLFKNVKLTGGFWKERQDIAVNNIIPYQEKAIKDQIPGIEPSHAVANFMAAARRLNGQSGTGTAGAGVKSANSTGTVEANVQSDCGTGTVEAAPVADEFYGMVFQDSDVAKWLEAASFSLATHPDKELEKRTDELIELVGKAQEPDGYLDTYFTLKRPDQKFRNLHDAHELYCAGHMIEAGVAHYEATGKKTLLDIVCRLADCIYRHFITEGAAGYPGHPEVELALMKLYRSTGNSKYLELAEHFVNVRGKDPDFFVKEMKSRNWNVWGSESVDPAYHQAHKPVRQQTEAVGHAVRAGYLYTAMADLAHEKDDAELFRACKTLWKNITQKRMYVTGGIGSTFHGEAFSADYDLPNDTAYSETCAAISLMMFAKQLLKNEKLGEYGDVMETSLYNTVLAGMQLDGRRFFYVNPLEVITGISGVVPTHRHALPERPGWYGCACCPPNVARTITDIADYAWLFQDGTLYSVLFMGNTLELNGLKVTEETEYPYDGRIRYSVCRTAPCNCSGTEDCITKLAVRIPSWAKNAVLSGSPVIQNGFAYYEIPAVCTDFVITIDLNLTARKFYCNTKVHSNSGKTAFAFGPLIYCAEEADNGDITSLFACRGEMPRVCEKTDELSGIRRLVVKGCRLELNENCRDSLYSENPGSFYETEISLIPYYAWANRTTGQMRVWIPER